MLNRRKSETQRMEKLERGFQMGIDFQTVRGNEL